MVEVLADAFGPLVTGGFEVLFIDQAGVSAQAPLAACWSQSFECCLPVRSFRSHRGQSNFPGLWWFSASGVHVGYESWLERDRLMFLDADPDVVAVVSQPFWLSWSIERRRVRHAPDFFARLTDGSGVVIDVREDGRVEPDDAAKFEATARACASVGWAYQRVGGLMPVLAANLRWLSGYRHPRCHDPVLATNLLEGCDGNRPMLAEACLVGDPIAVLPVVFHLLWRRKLLADLTAPLGPDTMVWAAGGLR